MQIKDNKYINDRLEYYRKHIDISLVDDLIKNDKISDTDKLLLLAKILKCGCVCDTCSIANNNRLSTKEKLLLIDVFSECEYLSGAFHIAINESLVFKSKIILMRASYNCRFNKEAYNMSVSIAVNEKLSISEKLFLIRRIQMKLSNTDGVVISEEKLEKCQYEQEFDDNEVYVYYSQKIDELKPNKKSR